MFNSITETNIGQLTKKANHWLFIVVFILNNISYGALATNLEEQKILPTQTNGKLATAFPVQRIQRPNQSVIPHASNNYLPANSGNGQPKTNPEPAAEAKSSSTNHARASGLPVHLQNEEPKMAPLVQPKESTAVEKYPAIGQMEIITFGSTNTDLTAEERLSKLEESILRKTFIGDSLFDRTERLKKTIFGEGSEVPHVNDEELPYEDSGLHSLNNEENAYFDEIVLRPENQQPISKEELEQFTLSLINYERSKLGLAPLSLDSLAAKLANAHVNDLCKRNTISHADATGQNPDERYTAAGGTGAITENLISLRNGDKNTHPSGKLTRALAARIIQIEMSRQDDREAIFNPDATHFAIGVDQTANKNKNIACIEVLTKHGIIHPIPHTVCIGDKVEVKGVVLEPYKFERITIAWEGLNQGLSSASDESDEALPYFPPLDYVAYAEKAQHDYEKTLNTLRTLGIIAAIAGGMFMPPVALAAPIIAMSGSVSEPKPVSDIPVHGGVKIEGSTFTGKVSISSNGKDGIYYISVWASLGKNTKPVPISRRTVIAKLDVSANPEAETTASKNNKKHHKKNKQALTPEPETIN